MLDETGAALYKIYWCNGLRFSGHTERCGPQRCSHIASKGVLVAFMIAFAPKRDSACSYIRVGDPIVILIPSKHIRPHPQQAY
jgi:hypothetical protein